jgi:hypothetical protein
MKKTDPRSTAAPDPQNHAAHTEKRPGLSLDWWTVLVGLALAALVLAGLPALPW